MGALARSKFDVVWIQVEQFLTAFHLLVKKNISSHGHYAQTVA